MEFTWLCSRKPIPTPFMPRLKPVALSLCTPSPYWLYGDSVPLCATAHAQTAAKDNTSAVLLSILILM